MLVNFFAFLTKFLSAKVTKLAAGKICNAHGLLRGDYGLLINQSEHAYYCSHIIMKFNGRYEDFKCLWKFGIENIIIIIYNNKTYIAQKHWYSAVSDNWNILLSIGLSQREKEKKRIIKSSNENYDSDQCNA